jgi:hypothetical protein
MKSCGLALPGELRARPFERAEFDQAPARRSALSVAVEALAAADDLDQPLLDPVRST